MPSQGPTTALHSNAVKEEAGREAAVAANGRERFGLGIALPPMEFAVPDGGSEGEQESVVPHPDPPEEAMD